ncbi:glycosyltransferase [Roseomonas sp. OT10]|uniref:glycosyltransferase n=1 Tax=Roseomonas cutis TaxID=2897332 RepID=UPI001E368941|nr:glycosyltransferase [Roseomonas sp. OT10]UFN47720.1 glycosyltransferase [Roseomonas sp. OT10]
MAEATAAAPLPLDLVFDVSDLVLHFHHRRMPTGIQRVQCGLVGAALRGPAAAETRLGCVVFNPDSCAWQALPAPLLLDLIRLSGTGTELAAPDWQAALEAADAALRAAPRHAFARGTMLVNLGNSWGLPDYFRGLRAAQRDSGLRYIPFLHDCVPLVVPEHCELRMVQDYARWFSAMAVHAHGILCNSQSTLAEGRDQLARLLPGLDLPMGVIRLDADPRPDGAPPDPGALAGLPGFRPGQPYALFVATVESRKDHLLVFRAWLSLIRRLGAARVPQLVCVGHKGWHAEAALAFRENSRELRRQVVLLHDVPDNALAALYEGCRFTIYNSFHEGWGLPVTESLAHGKVPVVPRHSALIESGAPGAVFFTPQHEPELTDTLERLIAEPGALEATEAAIPPGGGLRHWAVLKDEMLADLRAMAARPATTPENRLQIEPGRAYDMVQGEETQPALAVALRQMLREGPGWNLPEAWGVWSRGGTATLAVPLPAGASGRWRLYLDIVAPVGGGPVHVRVEALGEELAGGEVAPARGQGGCVLSFDLPEEARLLLAEIESTPFRPAGEIRILGAGLRRVMLCREDDLLSRLGWLEHHQLAPLIG